MQGQRPAVLHQADLKLVRGIKANAMLVLKCIYSGTCMFHGLLHPPPHSLPLSLSPLASACLGACRGGRIHQILIAVYVTSI